MKPPEYVTFNDIVIRRPLGTGDARPEGVRFAAHSLMRNAHSHIDESYANITPVHKDLRVLDQVWSTLDLYPGSRLILGNHHYYLRELLRGTLTPEDAVNWMDWGGVATVSAYSNRPVPDFDKIAEDIRRAFPHHVDVLENALTFKEVGRFCFVHAGIRPGILLENQDEYDLRWIRAGFPDHVYVLSHVVLHGHTITKSLRSEIHANRIALDTGAYRTGRLSAAVIKGDELSHFLCTELTETGVIQVGEWRPK